MTIDIFWNLDKIKETFKKKPWVSYIPLYNLTEEQVKKIEKYTFESTLKSNLTMEIGQSHNPHVVHSQNCDLNETYEIIFRRKNDN